VRLRDQLIGAVLLIVATWFGLHRIAEAKNETTVGGGVFRLDESRPEDMEAFRVVLAQITKMGDPGLADRLERLRGDGEIWVAPKMGPDRWAVFVDTLELVRRIYVRRVALLDPMAHLYGVPRPDIPLPYQNAHAWIGLAGALRHELAHHDGATEELPAFQAEIAWYESLRRSPFLASLQGEDRLAWEWGIESAILSARKALEKETGAAGGAAPQVYSPRGARPMLARIAAALARSGAAAGSGLRSTSVRWPTPASVCPECSRPLPRLKRAVT